MKDSPLRFCRTGSRLASDGFRPALGLPVRTADGWSETGDGISEGGPPGSCYGGGGACLNNEAHDGIGGGGGGDRCVRVFEVKSQLRMRGGGVAQTLDIFYCRDSETRVSVTVDGVMPLFLSPGSAVYLFLNRSLAKNGN